jgi:hypothetical protein
MDMRGAVPEVLPSSAMVAAPMKFETKVMSSAKPAATAGLRALEPSVSASMTRRFALTMPTKRAMATT